MEKEKQPEFNIGELQVISEAVKQSKDFSQSYTDDKFKSISWLMVGVVIVCFIAFIQLVVDSFHINSATYREYSKKLELIEDNQSINKSLLKQNRDNQQLILDQQKQIIDEFRNKTNGSTP